MEESQILSEKLLRLVDFDLKNQKCLDFFGKWKITKAKSILNIFPLFLNNIFMMHVLFF